MADTMDRIWAIKSIEFNSVVYAEDNGGPMSWNFDDSSNEIRDRVADQVYNSATLIPERDLTVSFSMRDVYTAITPGEKDDLIITLKKDDGTTDEIFTFKDMVYLSQGASGQKSTPAESTMSFVYEATGAARQTGASRITRASSA